MEVNYPDWHNANAANSPDIIIQESDYEGNTSYGVEHKKSERIIIDSQYFSAKLLHNRPFHQCLSMLSSTIGVKTVEKNLWDFYVPLFSGDFEEDPFQIYNQLRRRKFHQNIERTYDLEKTIIEEMELYEQIPTELAFSSIRHWAEKDPLFRSFDKSAIKAEMPSLILSNGTKIGSKKLGVMKEPIPLEEEE